MAIRKDGGGRRWVELEVLVPGTPEQVWHAMATGPGNSAWFTRAEIDGRVGGRLRFDFGGGMSSSGEVTFWEPPYRFGYVERTWSEGAPPVATEIVITSRSDGQCVVRMVHSLFSTADDWDGELEGFERGWPGYFEVLRIYLGHFADLPAASFQVMVLGLPTDSAAVWKRLSAALGIAHADAGDPVGVRAPGSLHGPQALGGVVRNVVQNAEVRMTLVQLDSPVSAVVLAGTYQSVHGVHASVSIFCYGEQARSQAEAWAGPWDEWLRDLLTEV